MTDMLGEPRPQEDRPETSRFGGAGRVGGEPGREVKDFPQARGRARTFLAFDVCGARFAVDLSRVVEVVRMVACTPLPGLSADVLGVIDYRGTVVPLLDPAGRLGLASRTQGLDSRIIVASTPCGPLGLVVEEPLGLAEVGPGELRSMGEMPVPAGAVERAFVCGAIREEEGLVLELDLELLLSSEEREALSALPVPPEPIQQAEAGPS